MNITKLNIIICFLLITLSASAMKYQIKVLNTPSITIDNKEAKVGDWFDDQSVIVWSKDNQAVVSEDNKVYALSAKLYKESKSKKFSDFIIYTKPLAARGTNNPDLIEQHAERFDNTFVMLDEIVIDLTEIDVTKKDCFILHLNNQANEKKRIFPKSKNLIIKRYEIIEHEPNEEIFIPLKVYFLPKNGKPSIITEKFDIELLSLF